MRLARRAIVALAAATVAATPAAAQQFLPRSTFVSILQTQKAYALKFVDVAPDSMLGFRPTPGVRTYAEQISHAAGSDAAIAHLIITGGFAGLPSMGDSAVYHRDKAALREMVTKSFDHAAEMIGALSDEQMMAEVSIFGNRLPRFRALMLLLDHFPWTLGQTVPYLRLNKVTPPSYSPF